MAFDEAASVALFAASEENYLASSRRRLPVPVLLVSGALGAGKTTLLNHILNNKLNLRVTAIVNDLAAINIDADILLEKRSERTVKLSNGCACHSLLGDLEEGLWQTLQETDGSERVDYVVIEMSGAAADPSRVVQALERRHGKMTRARLDGVALVIDADMLTHQLSSLAHESEDTDGHTQSGHEQSSLEAIDGTVSDDDGGAAARRLTRAAGQWLWAQLVQASVVALNKIDLLDADAASRVTALVQSAAPWAEVISCSRARVPLPRLLNVNYSSSVTAGVHGHEASVMPTGCFLTRAALDGVARSASALAPMPPAARARVGAGWATDPESHHRGYHTVEFTSASPLSLGAFQDLLISALCPPPSSHAQGAADESQHGVRAAFRGVLRRALRVKGVVWFAEWRTERWLFQLSGRGRVQLEHDGEWAARPMVQLVFIGRGRAWEADAVRLKAILDGLVAPEETLAVVTPTGVEDEACFVCDVADEQAPTRLSREGMAAADGDAHADAEVERARRMLHADPRFDLIDVVEASGRAENEPAVAPTPDNEPTASSVLGKRARGGGSGTASRLAPMVAFQLAGSALYGLSREQLERTHGVDVNDLTRRFVQQINASIYLSIDGDGDGDRVVAMPCILGALIEGAPSVYGTADDGGVPPVARALFCVHFAVGGGTCTLGHVWAALGAAADDLLARMAGGLNLCGADHAVADR